MEQHNRVNGAMGQSKLSYTFLAMGFYHFAVTYGLSGFIFALYVFAVVIIFTAKNLTERTA
jgi:hypothetical protein